MRTKKNQTVILRLTPEQKETLAAYSAQSGLSMSAAIRKMIDNRKVKTSQPA